MSRLRNLSNVKHCLALPLVLLGAVLGVFRAAAQLPPALLIRPGAGQDIVVSWPSTAVGFALEESASLEGTPAWQPSPLVPIPAGDTWTVTVSPSGSSRYFRLRAAAPRPLTRVSETSPANGANGVSVTRETVFLLSGAVAPGTVVDTNRLYARFGGRRILTRGELSTDRDRLSLFYLEDLPPGSRIEVTLNGNGLKDTSGLDVDVDGDGQPGGVRTLFFDTFSAAPIPRTAVVGKVYASDPAPGTEPGTFTNRPLAGVIITVDGAEETLRTVTDATGSFRLEPAPAGRFFVHVDGRSARGSNWPNGDYYPFIGKAWEAVAGQTNNLAAGSGEIFLPLIKQGTLQTVSAVQDTSVKMPAAVVTQNPALKDVELLVPANSLFDDRGNRGGRVGMAPVPPDRLPEPLPAGLALPLVITVQTDGAMNFDRPVPARFPNLPDPRTGKKLPPGAKSALWSFNHDTGRWELAGPMTVTPDGNYLETDPGTGIRQPGWHGTQPGTDGNCDQLLGGDGDGDGGGDGDGDGPDDDGDGTPNSDDDDTDGDGTPDSDDTDDDNDGMDDSEDEDDDNDGTPDDQEPDNDGDGEPDKTDPDDDNDGMDDSEDEDDDGDDVPDDEEPEEEEGPCDDIPGPFCGANAVAPIDQSDWPITSNDADAGGNYTGHRGFEIDGGVCLDEQAQAWKFRVSRLVWRGKINTSTNSGLISTEPVPVVGGNVTSNNYCVIVAEMRGYLGRGRGVWHMRAASLAHEIYHRDVDWPGITRPLWQNIEAAIEAESVPCDKDVSEAEVILRAKLAQSLASLENQFAAALTTFNAGHDGAKNDGAYQAGQAVLNGRNTQIGVFATTQGWPNCPGGNSRPAAPAADGPPTLIAIEAEVASPVIRPGQTVQVRVTGKYSDGSEADLTGAGATLYQSSRPGVATVNVTGLVTGLSAGSTSILVQHWPRPDYLPMQASVRITVPSAADQDNDGMPDAWERANGLNPADPADALRDLDNDGMLNLREYEAGTNPRVTDSDSDGVSDHQEIINGQNPLKQGRRNLTRSLGTHYFVLMNLETGRIEQRGPTGRNGEGHESLIMAPNSRYRQWVFHPKTGRAGTMDWITPDAGRRFILPAVRLRPDNSADTDGDGLRDNAEFVMGTNKEKADTDGDGVEDGAEIRNETNPTDGLPVATGVVGSSDTAGNAVDVAAQDDYVAVADSEAGVTIFNVEGGFTPNRVAQVDTPGTALGLALVSRPTPTDVLRVAVADGSAGLAVIDLALPANARLVRQVPLGATANGVAVRGGLGYVGLSSGEVVVVDLGTGTVLDRFRLPGNPNLQDIALSGPTLFALSTDRLFAIPVDEGELRVSANAASPGGVGAGQRRLRLFLADGKAYATHTSGFNVFDVTDRTNLRSLRQNNTAQRGWKQIVLNGSGLGIATVSPNSTDDGPHDVSVYDVGADGLALNFLATLPTPGLATAVTLYNGLAYVADGRSGLQVVNYLAYDSGNRPPTIALSADFPLDPPRAEEGKLVNVVARVTDDVQVSRVEFHVNGDRISTDGNYPFEARFVTPSISPGAGGNTFRLQARAFDTGGNFAWSTEYVVTLVPDATPPRILRRYPAAGAIIGSAQSISAMFDEPVDTETLNNQSIRVVFAGADGVLGTPDDARLETFDIDYRTDLNGLFLEFPAALAPGLYEVRLSAPLADRAGNALAVPAVWRFWILGQTDTDNDGVPDNIEQALGLNPNNPDSNGNGILDGQEDPDRDRLPTAWELVYGLDPRLVDSNSNGVNDDLEDNEDNDGLRNFDELRAGGSPRSADSDGDGWDDNGEFADGTRLNDPASTPVVRVNSAPASFLNAVPQGTPAGTPLTVASVPVSHLNAVAETMPAGTPITVASNPASFLNALAEAVPTGIPIQLMSPPASYLNALGESLPPATPVEVLSPTVSHLNAAPVPYAGPFFVPSPIVSYHNQP